MTRSSLTYAAVTSDRQANTEEHQGSPGTETKYCQGKSSSTHDTLRRHSPHEMLRGFIVLPVRGTLSLHVILLINDTNSRPRFHLYSSSAVILFPLLCLRLPSPNFPPSLPPTSLPISYTSKSFFLLSREFSAA